jgi:hypothetical protein
MSAPRTSGPLTDESEDCTSQVRRLANAHVPGLKHERPGQGTEELHGRLPTLEQWICELLIENQRLRMLLGEETTPMPRRADGQVA